jgi:hypothetical protein
VLGKFLLRNAGDATVPVEQDSAGRGGSLVEGEDHINLKGSVKSVEHFDQLPAADEHIKSQGDKSGQERPEDRCGPTGKFGGAARPVFRRIAHWMKVKEKNKMCGKKMPKDGFRADGYPFFKKSGLVEFFY